MNGFNNVVELGSLRTVYAEGGKRHVVRHNPPRDWKDVLADVAARMSVKGTQSVTVVVPAQGDGPTAPVVLQPHLDTVADPRAVPNVLDTPLLRLARASVDDSGRIQIRRSPGTPEDGGRPSLGQYRDFRDKPRSLPQLTGVTIKGVLMQTGALAEGKPGEDDLRRIAKAASNYRRAQGLGGGDCGLEATELYMRIFRALGMSTQTAVDSSAGDLQRKYLEYLRQHSAK